MTDKIKILHLTYHMGIGGTEQVIYQLVNNADSTLFDNSIACIEGEVGPIGQKLQQAGTTFHVLTRVPGFDTALIKAIRQLLKDHQIDIVHCHQYTPYVYGVLASMFTGTKVFFTEHGRFHPDRYSWKRRMVNPLLGTTTHTITAISEATKDALAHYEWFRSGAIKVIYNGIESQEPVEGLRQSRELQLTEDHLVHGTITRFDTIKNLPMMINAFASLHKTHPHSRLLLVGDGETRPEMEALVASLSIQDAVIFTGFQTDTIKYMSLIDVYVLSSFSEGTSMTLLEAMSLSKCCVVTAVGGNVEIINDRSNGLVVESDNTKMLVDALKSLADDSQLRQQLGAAAKASFDEKFDLDQMIQAFKLLYQAAAKKPSGRTG